MRDLDLDLESEEAKELRVGVVFRERLGDDVKVVAIIASAEARFGRLKSRQRADAPVDRAAFDMRDTREVGWGLEESITQADISIDNSHGLEAYREQVRTEVLPLLDG